VSVLLISDLHLCGDQPQTLALFSQFLRDYQHASQLYILGDLFEAWIGDDYRDPALQTVIAQLQQYAAGTATFFLHGNRDFLVGQRFADEIGCQLLPEAEIINNAGNKILIMHGDTLCSDDSEYQNFRRQVRSPQWQENILTLSVEERQQLARRFRLDSDSSKAMKAEQIMDVNQQTVETTMRHYDVHCLIHGHTHRPAHHQFMLQQQAAHRYVLGDWSDHAVIAQLDPDKEPQLVTIRLR